jgi:ribosome-binding factor A
MPKNFSRLSRINDLIHRITARLIREEFKDPRVGMITVSGVDVSADLKQAKIYVTVLEELKVEKSLKVLNEASGFFRSRFASHLKLRIIPKPHFIFDDSVIRGTRINSLLESCIRE